MSDESPREGSAARRTFTQFLAALEDGRLHQELTEQLPEIVATLNEHRAEYGGKPAATIALNFKFTLDGQNMQVDATTALKLPKGDRQRSIFWTTADNRLSADNPRQQRLPFGHVAAAAPAAGREI